MALRVARYWYQRLRLHRRRRSSDTCLPTCISASMLLPLPYRHRRCPHLAPIGAWHKGKACAMRAIHGPGSPIGQISSGLQSLHTGSLRCTQLECSPSRSWQHLCTSRMYGMYRVCITSPLIKPGARQYSNLFCVVQHLTYTYSIYIYIHNCIKLFCWQ